MNRVEYMKELEALLARLMLDVDIPLVRMPLIHHGTAFLCEILRLLGQKYARCQRSGHSKS